MVYCHEHSVKTDSLISKALDAVNDIIIIITY